MYKRICCTLVQEEYAEWMLYMTEKCAVHRSSMKVIDWIKRSTLPELRDM